MIRNIIYFERAGPLNTIPLIEHIKERVPQGDIKEVIVPVTTGKTADLFAQHLENRIKIIPISEDETLSACRRIEHNEGGVWEKLMQRYIGKEQKKIDPTNRRKIFDLTFLPFCGEKWELISEPFYIFGQGMKVAIEVSISAVETGKISPYTTVAAVGGTGEGVDTAIIVKTSTQKEAFGKNPDKRLAVYEILAMPREKW
ncbi:hypothetical protein [[Eubacterium] cellulosolvens]